MRRVMHVTTAHPVSDNRILRKECTALAQAGFDVILVAVHDRDEVLHGIPVLGLPRHRGRLSRMVLGPVAAWRRLSARRPDVVHGHDPELIPLLLLYRLVHPGCRVIYDAHEDLPQQVAGKPYLPRLVRPVVARAARALEGLADRGLDAVVVATPHIGRRHELARTVLVQNYPWLSDFPEPEPYPTDASPVVCYAGGISAGRGYEAMCALPRLVTRPLEVVLAGPCAEEVAGRPLPEGVTHLGTLAPDEVPRSWPGPQRVWPSSSRSPTTWSPNPRRSTSTSRPAAPSWRPTFPTGSRPSALTAAGSSSMRPILAPWPGPSSSFCPIPRKLPRWGPVAAKRWWSTSASRTRLLDSAP